MTKKLDPSAKQEKYSSPSKSQLKRDMKELQKLGKQLVETPQHLLKNIKMEEALSNAIILARRLGTDKSYKRQLQYIGKLLSQTQTDEIKQVLDNYSQQQKSVNTEFHYIEKWRDKLIQEGINALNELINEHQNLDRQHLWQLIRNAQKEASEKKPPASSRVIFSYLRDNIEFDDSEEEE